MPTNEIARSTILYVLVADANQSKFDYRALLPAGNVQWGFAGNPEIFGAALRLQPWDVILVDDTLVDAIPPELLAAADFVEEGQLVVLLVEPGALDGAHTRGLTEYCGYLLKGPSLQVSLARVLRHALYDQAVKQQRGHLEAEISRILSGWESSVRDRTRNLERRNAELQAIDELKNQFLENVSHELRTPMTLVRSYVELLIQHPPEDEEERSEFLHIIDAETKHLSRMIDDLLDLARLNSGNMTWKMGEVRMSELITRVVKQLTPLLEKAGVSCAVSSEGDVPAAWGDSARLSQVLINLIENAVKHSPKGHIDVRLSMCSERVDSELRDMAQVVVEDNGTGIPPAMLEAIFERFTQAGDTNQGTGLGLAICREIVTHHGGKIWAANGKNGAVLTFLLPLAGHLDVISGSYTQPDPDDSRDQVDHEREF